MLSKIYMVIRRKITYVSGYLRSQASAPSTSYCYIEACTEEMFISKQHSCIYPRGLQVQYVTVRRTVTHSREYIGGRVTRDRDRYCYVDKPEETITTELYHVNLIDA